MLRTRLSAALATCGLLVGGALAFGDAIYLGSTGNLRLNRPVLGSAARLIPAPPS